MGEDEGRRPRVGPLALVADLHLAPDAPAEVEALEGFLAVVRERTDRLCILGDLFDYWVGRGMERLPALRPYMDALAGSGLHLTFLPGNRDFLAPEGLHRAAGVVAGGEELLLADPEGRAWLLLHGDQLCTADRPYQRARRVLRSLPVRALVPLIPLGWRYRMARWLRRRSTRSIERRQAWTVLPTREAVVRRRDELGLTGLFCGHIHRPLRGTLTPGGDVVLHVLPPWCAAGGWVLLEGSRPRLMDPEGGEIPWPDPVVLD